MKTRSIYLFSLALVLIASSLVNVGAQDVSAGKKLIETYQWNKANKLFIDLVKANPADPSLKFYLAETYFALGQVDSAESNYAKGPEYALSIAGLGKITLSKGDTVKAKEIFNKAIKAQKKNGDLYGYIADACISYDFPKLAEQYIARGKDITTKSPGIYMAAGNLAAWKGNAGDAANAYENAFYYDKNLVFAKVKVGLIYTESRSWDAAAKAFNEAIAVDANYPLAYKGLGDMYYKSGKFQEASDNYKKYFSLSEVTLEDNYRYAFILFYNKEYAAATKMIQDLLATDSKNPVLLRIQAYISYELGVDEKKKVTNAQSIESAYSNITKFFELQPVKKLLSSDYEYLAKIQIAKGLDSLAPDNYKKAFLMDSSRLNLLDDGAKVAVKSGKFLKAADFYNIMNRVAPENLGVNTFKMGQMYYFEAVKNDTAKADTIIRRANLIKADTIFQTVARLIPSSPLGYFWAARTESQIDLMNTNQVGLPFNTWDKLVKLVETEGQLTKRKTELFEAYNYFGSYYYFKAYDALKAKNMSLLQELKDKSKEYWMKMKGIAPESPKADEGIKAVDELKPAVKKAAATN